MATQTVVQPTGVLGKRKASSKVESYLLHLSSSPEPSNVPSDSDYEPVTLTNGLMTINGALDRHPAIVKPYKCVFDSCDKAYSKPSRLAEHERSHTGQRPFICSTCQKSYLRESHLHAHTRSHLPESDRPLVCSYANCGKRFWTSQHLRVHENLHTGEKPFKCPEPSCSEAFAKHHQLRSHLCSAHAPAGTKPYQCSYSGCSKSFATNQKLRAHAKVHDEKRYTCVQPGCIPAPGSDPKYYPTWSALQHHIRVDHPPTCNHPTCNGRTFTSQKGLRAHAKLHEQRDHEAELEAAIDSDADSAVDERPRKKRRGGEVGRDWKCEVDGCMKDFKSKKALTTHRNVTHLGRRDFTCTLEGCGRSFGYKHLLQRHFAKSHRGPATDTPDESPMEDSETTDNENTLVKTTSCKARMDIDGITGHSYVMQAREKLQRGKALRCPYPKLEGLSVESSMIMNSGRGANSSGQRESRACEYVFRRGYDLRRHFTTEHQLLVSKESIDDWIKTVRS